MTQRRILIFTEGLELKADTAKQLISFRIPTWKIWNRYEIDGKNVYANVTEYTTIPWEEAKYESHRDYTDIQYMIRGTETMTYAPVDALNVKVPYNEEKDCVLYDNANPGLKVVVGAGEYMIFQPWDGHKPKAADGEPAPIKKVIVKIKEN